MFLEKYDKRLKKIKHVKNEFIPLPLCSKPNQMVHMDLFGPLKTTERRK
jgi:hypothetical protein